MQIAILSGKGGTGKTTVSTNLARLMGCRYVDCDVEEPNGAIFLKPNITETKDVKIPIPIIDENKCTGCKKCVNICQFNALALVKQNVMLFEKLCHGCGACTIVCPVNAITEQGRTVGKIDIGKYEDNEFFSGTLNIGEPMAGPIISQLKRLIGNSTTIIDCSPGSSCNVVKAVQDVDYAILVTEPTAFGLHDLKIAVDLVRKMNIPFGVIINRVTEDDNLTSRYCDQENITILGTIPFDKKIAVHYSNGKLLIEEDESFKLIFEDIASNLQEVNICN
ncbi:ATP-binding protein [Brassicibacter mesophilus]|jgi:MinD superfamily P-loop ATPase|uniref:ATP-binding protein n=1 Tax=Brassicibacter mesophilus TaxID=745119 RepID=UPI003D1909BE